MSPRRSSKKSGFTIMILAGPGQKPRRLHVPRWALAAFASAWLLLMGAFVWLGFYSFGSATRAPARTTIQGTVATKAGDVPASSPLSSRHE
jgi:hypothetical protein